MLSRREMGAPVRLAAVLSSAVAGGRLGAEPAHYRRPACRRHPAAPHPGRHRLRARPEREAGCPGRRAGPHRRSLPGRQPGRCPGVGGRKPRPLRADGPPDTGLSRHPRTGESLPREYDFPTRRYDGGALPAGRYDAVRLDIGTRRAGRNWWCVLYPGLCRSACGGYDTPAENDLVCGEYIVRFRFVEWWDGLTAPREDVVLPGEQAIGPPHRMSAEGV